MRFNMSPTSHKHSYPLAGTSEFKRLQNQHEVIKDAMGGLVLAPIDLKTTPLQILDSGTADGTWIRDLEASLVPVQHSIYGTDLDPVGFPDSISATTVYTIQDITQAWPRDWEGKFDLVHQRLVLFVAGRKQKEAVLSLCSLVKPGGWIQLIEATNRLPDGCGPHMNDLVNLMKTIFVEWEGNLDLMERIPKWLREVGFVDVNFVDVKMKLGATNPKAELAQRGVISTSFVAQAFSQIGQMLPPGTLSISADKLETLSHDLEEELQEMGALYPLRVIWARKPM